MSLLSCKTYFICNLRNGITSFAEAKSVDDIALIKLGCEIHSPEDPMMINRSTVLYWEDLRSDVQVAMGINNRKTANPNGQDCTTTAANGRSRYGTYYKRNGIGRSDTRNRVCIL